MVTIILPLDVLEY